METGRFLWLAREHLQGKGFRILQPEPREDGSYVKSDLYAQNRGRSFGPFFPYEDHLFFHDLSGMSGLSRANVDDLHERARAYVNGFFKVPRSLRYKVPNIVTLAVTRDQAPDDLRELIMYPGRDMVGGETHSILMIKLPELELLSRGLETTRTSRGSMTFTHVNPGNRALILIRNLLKTLQS